MSKRRKVGQIEHAPVAIDIESDASGACPRALWFDFSPAGRARMGKSRFVNNAVVQASEAGKHILYGYPTYSAGLRLPMGTITGRFSSRDPHPHKEVLPRNGADIYFTGLPTAGPDWVRQRFLDADFSKLEERALAGIQIWDEAHSVVIDSLSSLEAYAKADAETCRRWVEYGMPPVEPLSYEAWQRYVARYTPPPVTIRIHRKELVPQYGMMLDWEIAARKRSPVAHEYYKRDIERRFPAVHTLMNAAWQAGHTCNGIKP